MSWADDTVAALAVLPGFPPASERAARATLASTLERILLSGHATIEEALRMAAELVELFLDYDKWPGPGHFFTQARRLRYPEREYSSPEVPHLAQYLPAPETATACEQCNDFGYRLAGEYLACSCPAGEGLGPVFLELLNGRTEKARGPVELKRVTLVGEPGIVKAELSRLITRADIEDALHLRSLERALKDPKFATGGKLPHD